MKILLTGVAGFIGYHTAYKLLLEGYEITGLDNLNTYYDVDLKLRRLESLGIKASQISDDDVLQSENFKNFQFVKIDIANKHELYEVISKSKPDVIIHLAAQAGVRYSLDHPEKYLESNIHGFLNLMEAIKERPLKHFIFASSSSVYGLNKEIPFKTNHHTDHPISLYAATKKSNEMMAHTYSHLFNIPMTGLRFFTVYGPWGRPDMAMFIFTKNILEGKKINVYNNGQMSRDFTYISDIVDSISKLIDKVPNGKTPNNQKNLLPNESTAAYQLFNIGYNSPTKLTDFIKAIEKHTGKKAKINFQPLQPGDVENTFADVSDLFEYIDFKPKIGVDEGVEKFVEWFRGYYNC